MSEQRRKPTGRTSDWDWGITTAIFLTGLTIALLFLFAVRGHSSFCVTTEAPAACVREWLAMLAPWAAIAGVIWATHKTAGPVVRQWQEMRRQSSIMDRTHLANLAISYADLRVRAIALSSTLKAIKSDVDIHIKNALEELEYRENPISIKEMESILRDAADFTRLPTVQALYFLDDDRVAMWKLCTREGKIICDSLQPSRYAGGVIPHSVLISTSTFMRKILLHLGSIQYDLKREVGDLKKRCLEIDGELRGGTVNILSSPAEFSLDQANQKSS